MGGKGEHSARYSRVYSLKCCKVGVEAEKKKRGEKMGGGGVQTAEDGTQQPESVHFYLTY